VDGAGNIIKSEGGDHSGCACGNRSLRRQLRPEKAVGHNRQARYPEGVEAQGETFVDIGQGEMIADGNGVERLLEVKSEQAVQAGPEILLILEKLVQMVGVVGHRDVERGIPARRLGRFERTARDSKRQ